MVHPLKGEQRFTAQFFGGTEDSNGSTDLEACVIKSFLDIWKSVIIVAYKI